VVAAVPGLDVPDEALDVRARLRVLAALGALADDVLEQRAGRMKGALTA
jgi:hypothetical protein